MDSKKIDHFPRHKCMMIATPRWFRLSPPHYKEAAACKDPDHDPGIRLFDDE